MQTSWPIIQVGVIFSVLVICLNMTKKLKIIVLDKKSYEKAKQYFAHFNANESAED